MPVTLNVNRTQNSQLRWPRSGWFGRRTKRGPGPGSSLEVTVRGGCCRRFPGPGRLGSWAWARPRLGPGRLSRGMLWIAEFRVGHWQPGLGRRSDSDLIMPLLRY